MPKLDYGVMVTLQVLVLSFPVRIGVVQQIHNYNEKINWIQRNVKGQVP